MTREQAKETLSLYRPGTADAEDPDIIAAMATARQDPELAAWFKDHCAFQQAMRNKLRGIPVPPRPPLSGIRLPLPATQRPWWPRRAWFAAAMAVCIVLVVTLGSHWWRPRTPDRYADFRQRMVGTVLRTYNMDIVTNDMGQVRSFLQAHGAPANYTVPQRLSKLSLTGAGLLRWRDNPVSMVCFDRGTNQMVFLFVMQRSAVEDPPPAAPEFAQVNELRTASWSEGDKTYFLAVPEEAGSPQDYL